MTNSTVYITKEFLKCQHALLKKGKIGKSTWGKVCMVATELSLYGDVTCVQPTKHGETRIQNCTKYDLGDGYRLVTQRFESTKVLLYVGDHDDEERWLNGHKGFVWTQRDKDKSLNFVQYSQHADLATDISNSPQRLQNTRSDGQLPLLGRVADSQWQALSISNDLAIALADITVEKWRDAQDACLSLFASKVSEPNVCLLIDLCSHAFADEWDEFNDRLEVALGRGSVPSDSGVVAAIAHNTSTDVLVQFDMAETIPTEYWEEWMLFLPSEQRFLVDKDFDGPSRLRGVSGSGKTCVLVHRARRLAKATTGEVLVVTLTRSMANLLRNMFDHLCGAESARIKVATVNSIAHEVLERILPPGMPRPAMIDRAMHSSFVRRTVKFLQAHNEFGQTRFRHWDNGRLEGFVDEELRHIRTRLTPIKYERYLDTKRYQRTGRGMAIDSTERSLMFKCVKYWDSQLAGKQMFDNESLMHLLLFVYRDEPENERNPDYNDINVLSPHARYVEENPWGYTENMEDQIFDWVEKHGVPAFDHVLVDEVQDLTQTDLRFVHHLVSAGTNNLFLVGDGTQAIYARGFSLASCGIRVANRSYCLNTNYRNTFEILAAAYLLVQRYEFPDVDETDLKTPLPASFARRHGPKPWLVRCNTIDDEFQFIVDEIVKIRDSNRARAEADQPQICVVAMRKQHREEIAKRLTSAGVSCVAIKDDRFELVSDEVVISTIESAKGYEFNVVFIVNVIESVIPDSGTEVEIRREASRLYVAMTRARDRLVLSYSTRGSRPSPFLADIQERCYELRYRRGNLSAITDDST